ncbi:MAG: LPS-assembly protein LptD [Treponema sp.]|jgi:lipopolysaccharide assembly outer membrane protein LptD (OstA)|nr:LPS-assembly protein LptD [Treponema sp.]
MKRPLSFAILFLSAAILIEAQEGKETSPVIEAPAEAPSDPAVPDDPEGSNDPEEPNDPEAGILEMEIKTSSLMELASWCRELGLSDGGTKDDLANRLRGYFKLPASGALSAVAKVITIESARTTEYFTLDVVDEEYARLRGDVVISLKDGDAVHRVTAWEILYNRTRNILTASGGVVYIKEEGDTVETFKGESITVNLDNWSSIFMDGISERSISGNDTAYRFAGTVISRNSEEVTVLTRAEITNAKNEEAYWSLNASKLWLLPGSDWAILNAVLKVGNVPVLYLPFFFYPSDEIVFHPVVGFRSREGTFLQTTTYILGRPKTSGTSENSITKIFGSSADMEKVREGVFLRSTGKKYRDPNDTRLSVLFDAYANLGAYLGTELALPRKGAFGAFDLSFGLGLTRNIYPMGSVSTPFPRYDGVSEWNSSRLFSREIPLRYRFNMTGSVSAANSSLSWAFPYYSDPYVNRDFLNRSEELDWLSMLREGATAATQETEDTYLSSYAWTLNGRFSPSFPSLAPYISSFSVSSISSSLNFGSRILTAHAVVTAPPNPDYMFFYPNKFTILSANASLRGTPYTSGSAVSTRTAAPAGQEKAAAPGDSLLPALPRSPWGDEEVPNQIQAQKVPQDPYSLAPPALSQLFETSRSGGPRIAFDYNLNPTFGSELQFRTSPYNWKTKEDIDWSEISSMLSRINANSSIGVSLTPHSGSGAYSGSFRLNGTGAWQGYNYINEEAEEFVSTGQIEAARERAYNQTYVTSTWEASTSVKPFYRSSVWGNTSLKYSLGGLLARTKFDGSGVTDTEDNPIWDWEHGDWTKEKLNTHSVSASIAASVMDYNQNLTVSAVLPPKDASLDASATVRAWISETSANTSITEPWDEDKRVFKPVNVTETLKFGSFGSFQQYIVYDPEQEEYTNIRSSLNLGGSPASYTFSAIYTMTYGMPYRVKYDTSSTPKPIGWEQYGGKDLNPLDLSLNFRKSFKKDQLWNKRLSFSVDVNSGIKFDLQRYTYSSLSFSLGFSVGIANFMELSFSTSSANSQIYRYFQDLPFFSTSVDLPSGLETNFFKDLINSFRFDDPELRRSSGFKLKSFNLTMVHHLGDWNAKLGITLSPYLDQTGSKSDWHYKFNNQISFLVQWVPIEEIRTEMTYEKDKITFK